MSQEIISQGWTHMASHLKSLPNLATLNRLPNHTPDKENGQITNTYPIRSLWKSNEVCVQYLAQNKHVRYLSWYYYSWPTQPIILLEYPRLEGCSDLTNLLPEEIIPAPEPETWGPSRSHHLLLFPYCLSLPHHPSYLKSLWDLLVFKHQ